jgi:hypothetical protein
MKRAGHFSKTYFRKKKGVHIGSTGDPSDEM